MLTAVVDIGKTHTRLVAQDGSGNAVAHFCSASPTRQTAGGWPALDHLATEAWLFDALSGLGKHRTRLQRLFVTTHGAAVAALAGEGLALPVPDYEFAGFDDRSAATLQELDPFEATLSPVLPRGLNLGLQLDWLDRHEAAALARADTLLPYPQYWAWRLSGERASEVSSLGCHTLLWQPRQRRFSLWAHRRGWARRFAPLRAAWEALGPLRTELARTLSLPEDIQVHTGAHDSNACLARWLRHWPRLTLVSSGTWVVVMAPGVETSALDPQAGELGNVSVRNDLVPTARFMGGRELLAVCAGADPALADLPTLGALLARGLRVGPAFEGRGGPYKDRVGTIVDARGPVEHSTLTLAERATAAACYVAQMTAHLIERLGGARPVILEGPFAHNRVIVEVLAALLPANALFVVKDDVEGTVQGGAILSRWTDVQQCPSLPATSSGPLRTLIRAAYEDWLLHLSRG
jgi:L-fuculokinase